MLCPTKLSAFYKEFQGKEFSLLDVGCGNHVVQIFKKWFPQVRYYGIDREVYHNSPEDFARMEAFYELDLEKSDLREIPDESFDFINMAHVLEHLHRGFDVLDKLLPKLKRGGRIYIEFPSERSLHMPSARGTLHFSDDTTHVYVHSVREVSNFLMQRGLRIIKGGRVSGGIRSFIGLFFLPYQIFSYLRHGKMTVKWGLWSLFGFADYVYAVKV